MLDFDLATLYNVPTKALNQAVKRNIKRFPDDFMFRLNELEWNMMRSQFVTASPPEPFEVEVRIVSQAKRNSRLTPYAFTEQGIAMLSGVLSSDRAINMNIAIMRAFVELRKILIEEHDLRAQIKLIKERLGEHDVQLNQIYDAMENLLEERVSQKNWEHRERIGFK